MPKLLIHGATIYTPLERLEGYSLLIDGGKIIRLEPASALSDQRDAHLISAGGLFLTPGFIDLQFNGALGFDFTTQPESIWQVGAQLGRYGVTSFLPTIITSPLESITKAQQTLLSGRPQQYRGAEPLGLHVEGPFLNPGKKGAHAEEYLRPPNIKDYADISRQQGVLLVTLAPELPGADVVTQTLVQRGVVVSAGHSQATYEQALAAFDQGVQYGTHIFNAMPPFSHFEPGLVGALLSDQRPYVGLIADRIHVHPAVIRMIWRTVGAARLTLVTDAMAALGMPPGRYHIGDREVLVDETSARLVNGVLAGSILSLDTALRNLISTVSCDLSAALQTISLNPARLLGLSRQCGKIAVGQRADLTLLNAELGVEKTIRAGEIIYSAAGPADTA